MDDRGWRDTAKRIKNAFSGGRKGRIENIRGSGIDQRYRGRKSCNDFKFFHNDFEVMKEHSLFHRNSGYPDFAVPTMG